MGIYEKEGANNSKTLSCALITQFLGETNFFHIFCTAAESILIVFLYKTAPFFWKLYVLCYTQKQMRKGHLFTETAALKKTQTLIWSIFVCYGAFRNNLTPVLEEKIKMTDGAVRS